ncbi:MAG: hypothetical protein K6U89_11810 [Chloroflexi bacterium]|nr:hypothetical protein [Chloroflexota bacterium]
MNRWLDRVRRWVVRLAAATGAEHVSARTGSGLIWEGPEGPAESVPDGERLAAATPSSTLSVAATAPLQAAPRFSVWERLAGDPAAAAVRAKWESRWDEF